MFDILAAGSQPTEIFFSSPSSPRPRRIVCREVSDYEDDGYLRRPSNRHQSSSWSDQPRQSPPALHNILSRVWQKAEQQSKDLPSSFSAPDINSQWQAMRNRTPPPPRSSANNVWQAMRNASAPMQQPTGNIIQPPPPPLQNREAVQDFNAVRNLPYGINAGSPNREAVQDFNAVRNLPYGINAGSPNREAVQDFFAARNLPYGVNAGSPNREAVQDFFAARNLPYGVNPITPNQEAVQDFNAIRNLPYGINAAPPSSNAAINNFLAARNVPFGINQPNPAVANVWNRADYAAQHAPPMINIPWNQGPPSSPPPLMNNMWNRMQQGPPSSFNSPYPSSPMGMPQGGPSNFSAPTSFASLLSQAHRQQLPYAGVA